MMTSLICLYDVTTIITRTTFHIIFTAWCGIKRPFWARSLLVWISIYNHLCVCYHDTFYITWVKKSIEMKIEFWKKAYRTYTDILNHSRGWMRLITASCLITKFINTFTNFLEWFKLKVEVKIWFKTIKMPHWAPKVNFQILFVFFHFGVGVNFAHVIMILA